jgi:hypothetical protein
MSARTEIVAQIYHSGERYRARFRPLDPPLRRGLAQEDDLFAEKVCTRVDRAKHMSIGPQAPTSMPPRHAERGGTGIIDY